MARQKRQPARVDESENSPIEVEEDSPARPPNSSPPTSLQNHQTKLGEAYFHTYLTQFDDHQQPTFFDDNLYENPCKNPVMISKTPSLCYEKDKEETPEREEFLRKLKRKNKYLKKEIKEYQVLNRVIQQENNQFKAQSTNLQKEIRRLKRKNKKISDTALQWAHKIKFQVAKTKVLHQKIKALKYREGTLGGNLNILVTTLYLQQIQHLYQFPKFCKF